MLALLREVIDDAGLDKFWSDATLLGYLAEGQDEFCERTGYFRDFTSYSVVLAEGVSTYAIPDRVLEITNIWDGTRRLGKFQEQDRGKMSPDWTSTESLPRTGTPRAWQTDRNTGSITFDSVPTAAEEGKVLTLSAWRYSLFALDDNDVDPEVPDTTAEPEIPARFHHALIEWAAFKAYSTHDAEKQDKIKARDHENSFFGYASRGKRQFQRHHGEEVRVGISPAYRT
jgi:hypothetical protein